MYGLGGWSRGGLDVVDGQKFFLFPRLPANNGYRLGLSAMARGATL